MAQLNYDVNKNETEESFDVVPAGEYIAVIKESDYVDNSKGTGKILKFTYEIIDGPGDCKGRKVFENLNIVNTSTQAEAIARKALNSIGIACGVDKIVDSSQLHNKPLLIEITVKENPTYGKQNGIKKHLPATGTVPEQGTIPTGHTGTEDVSTPASPAPPWLKK